MFELLYQQAYALKWKHLAALLEMFNPQTRRSPTEKVLKELIDEEYVFYDSEVEGLRLSPNWQGLIQSFLESKVAVSIEAPRVQEMESVLSLYYLPNHRHMLVLIHLGQDEDSLVEAAISDTKSSPVKLYEVLGKGLGKTDADQKAEGFDPDHLPEEYQKSYRRALEKSRLFRVTLHAPDSDDPEDGVLSMFAAFPGSDGRVWLTAMRQKLSKDQRPILVQKLPEKDYERQLTTFFAFFQKQIEQER